MLVIVNLAILTLKLKLIVGPELFLGEHNVLQFVHGPEFPRIVPLLRECNTLESPFQRAQIQR